MMDRIYKCNDLSDSISLRFGNDHFSCRIYVFDGNQAERVNISSDQWRLTSEQL